MRPIRSVSVHMPTYQGMEFLERVLGALFQQRLDVPWDVHVIDSGSKDGTYEFLRQAQARAPIPMRLERIHSVEFDHGDTRNLMASRSQGDLLVFLTQDAIPSGPDWLATLVKNFASERVGAAYCRNVPRPDALLSTKILSKNDPGYATERLVQEAPANFASLTPDEQRLLYNFNDVASAIRRELWELHPFPRTNFGEDVLLARALIQAGYQVVYDHEATVEHSHDYDAQAMRARGEIDGRFNAQWLGRVCLRSQGDVEFLLKRCANEDRIHVERLGLDAGAARALLAELAHLRRALFEGLCVGSQDPVRRPSSKLRTTDKLRLLYVVHGFPPETWAGTEIYTYNLAKGMVELGHEVTILARSPGDKNSENFSLSEDTFEGLRVLRLVNRLAHRSLRDSFADDRASEVFARVLAAVRPDVVHFQHLIHQSVDNVASARSAGCATVITCHDFWGLCARVQMIQPDGTRCDEPKGTGCYACIKDKGPAWVERLRGWNPALLERAAKTSAWLGRSGGRWQRSSQEFLHMQDRQREVLAAYATADLRISPSRFLRQMYLDHAPLEPHAFVYSDNGMRTDHVTALRKERQSGDPIRFGFVGSLVWYKGGETLVRALQQLRGRKAELHVFGAFDPSNDEHHATLERLAEGLAVKFHGRFNNAQLAEVYAQIDVLVVPSLWFENSPITIHEAHLTRTPVLSSNIGGMAEYVRDGVDGLHFAVGDERALAQAMARFLDEPNLLADLSKDFPPLKTIDDNVREMEFRYRALAAIERQAEACAPKLVWRGKDHSQTGGAVDRQGADLALLRPGGWAEYPVPMASGGQLAVFVLFLAEEPSLVQAGRILLGETPIASLLPRAGNGRLESFRITLDVQSGMSEGPLRVETHGPGGPGQTHLRIESIAWQPRVS